MPVVCIIILFSNSHVLLHACSIHPHKLSTLLIRIRRVTLGSLCCSLAASRLPSNTVITHDVYVSNLCTCMAAGNGVHHLYHTFPIGLAREYLVMVGTRTASKVSRSVKQVFCHDRCSFQHGPSSQKSLNHTHSKVLHTVFACL